ncbi:hypothetical protein P7C70_g4846, partial [Phenoliferia sp. Uapishka_3]
MSSLSAPQPTRRPRSSTLSSTLEPLSESTVVSLPSRASPPRPHKLSFENRPRHRHFDAAVEALSLIRDLAEQATKPRVELHQRDGNAGKGKEGDLGIIANLESWDWVYHGEKSGVRIFSQEEDSAGVSSNEREGSHGSSARTAAASTVFGSAGGVDGKSKGKQGIRAHEALPFFRGEAWIEGSWRTDDVAAVVRSFGARAVCLSGLTLNPAPLYEPLSTVLPTLNKRPPPIPRPPSLAPSMRRRSSSEASGDQAILRSSTSSANLRKEKRPFEYSLSKGDPSAMASSTVSKLPGVWISFVARSSPGGNLPQTYVNQLSLSLPLGLAQIDRYLHAHGFPPHVERVSHKPGLDILDESYDAAGGSYNLVYRVDQSLAAFETRIRFFGSAFSRGNFSIEVFRATGWRLEYDVEPEEPPTVRKEDDEDEPETNPARSRRRTSISVLSTPASTSKLNSSSSPQPETFSFPRRGSRETTAKVVPVDSAKLVGPAGGCTIIIPNLSCAGCMPVTVCISKNPEAARATMDSMMVGGALGRAAAFAQESSRSDSIEQLLGSATGEAELALQGARAVLKQLRKEREASGGAMGTSRNGQ